MNFSCKIASYYEIIVNFNAQKDLIILICFMERLENSIKSAKSANIFVNIAKFIIFFMDNHIKKHP